MAEQLSYQINVDAEEWAKQIAKTHGIPSDFPFYNLFYDRRRGVITVEFVKTDG